MKKVLFSILATAAVMIGTIFLKDGPADVVWRVLHTHSLFPYLVICFAFWSLLVSIANQWKPNILQLLPCFWGAFGFLWEHCRVFAYLLDFMSGAWEISDLKGFVREAIRSIALPIEILILGTGLSLVLFTITACVNTYRCESKK